MGSGYDDGGVWSVVGNGKRPTNYGCDNNNGGVQVTGIPLVVVIVMSLVIVMLVQNSESFLIFEFTASRKLMVLGMEVRGLKVRPLKYFLSTLHANVVVLCQDVLRWQNSVEEDYYCRKDCPKVEKSNRLILIKIICL